MVPSTRDQKLNICRNIIRELIARDNAQRERFPGKKMCYKQFFNDCALKTNLNYNNNCSLVVWERSH